MQASVQLKTVVALLLECAYGRAIYSMAGRTPPRHARVEVELRESAFNPLSPNQHLQSRDETLFVAFQQRIAFHVGPHALCVRLSSLMAVHAEQLSGQLLALKAWAEQIRLLHASWLDQHGQSPCPNMLINVDDDHWIIRRLHSMLRPLPCLACTMTSSGSYEHV